MATMLAMMWSAGASAPIRPVYGDDEHIIIGRGRIEKKTYEWNKYVQSSSHNLRPSEQRHNLSKCIEPQWRSRSTSDRRIQRNTDEERDGREEEYPC